MTCTRKEKDKYGLPSAVQLENKAVLAKIMDKMIATDSHFDEITRQGIYFGVSWRYNFALYLYSSAAAFEIWRKTPLILGLPRKPKKPDDICRALFHATYIDPKKASKRFKCVEPMWRTQTPVDAVERHLSRNGLKDTRPGAPPSMKEPKNPAGDAKPARVEYDREDEVNEVEEMADDAPLPYGQIYGVAGKFKAGTDADARIRIRSNEGGKLKFYLLNISHTYTN